MGWNPASGRILRLTSRLKAGLQRMTGRAPLDPPGNQPGESSAAAGTGPSRRTSPSRRVKPMRSRYSPIGTAYFRVVPSRSRSSAIVMAEPSASRSLTRRRSSRSTSVSRKSCA